MTLAAKLLSGMGGEDNLYVDDVFSAYTYTGNGATQTINNGIDLAGKGGMVWLKGRDSTYDHMIVDSLRGVGSAYRQYLPSNSTSAQTESLSGITTLNSNGFSLGGSGGNQYISGQNGYLYSSWTFRNADKFFKVATLTKSAGSNATLDLSNLGTVGMVKVKRTDAAGSWYVWHRSLSAGKLLIGETTATEATLGQITVSGTTVTLVNGVIADGTYLVEAFAHDPSADGIIQCGSFTTDASGNATVNHGWTAGVQFTAIKASSTSGDWEMYDTARTSGWSGNDARLRANLPNAEDSVARLSASGTSISFAGLSASATYVYVFVVAPT